MKSWIHEISESYVEKRRPERKDLLEHYRALDEHQKFDLMRYNMMVYLDEQVKTAYGVNLEDLNENQLDELFGGLAGAVGGLAGAFTRGAQKVRDVTVAGAKKVASAVAKPVKAGLDYYGAGEEARGEVAAERGREIQAADTVGGKLRAATPRGKGMMSALRAGYRKGLGGVAADSPEETPPAETPKETPPAETPKTAPETTSRMTIGGDETVPSGTVTGTGRTGRGTVQLGASGASQVSLRRPSTEEPASTPESSPTPPTKKPAFDFAAERAKNRQILQGREEAKAARAGQSPQAPATKKLEDISIPDLPVQPFKAPRQSKGSVSLGADGQTKNTSRQFMSKSAVEAGAHLRQAAENIPRRRRGT